LCQTGYEQSPINIPDPSTLPTPSSEFNFVTFAYELLGNINLELQNDQNYSLNFGPYSTQNYVIIQKDSTTYKYNLVDMYIKYKGEHKFNDQETDLEIQLIHQKDTSYVGTSVFNIDPDPDRINLIIAMAFKVNSSTTGSFLENLNVNTRSIINNLDLNKFINNNKGYYYYAGSETTPPCEEDADWVVLSDIQGINSIQLNSIKDWITSLYPNGNARTAKSALNRKVYYYPPVGERNNGAYLKISLLAFILIFLI
jgi:carbonic anhydrase